MPEVSKDSKCRRPLNKKQIIYASAIVVGAIAIGVGLWIIIGGYLEDATARTEYDQLRTDFPAISENVDFDTVDEDEYENLPEALTEEDMHLRTLSLDELAAINNDFIGWINIAGIISYPVVRGNDNDKYINTTFTGAHNSAGAIFMDYRNTNNFDEFSKIIYGHHTRDGSMFAPLSRFLDSNFLRQNPDITVTTRDGRTLTYRVFAAKVTDAWDPAYGIALFDPARAAEEFPNAPANARGFMLLSTCTRSRDRDERILVFAALT